MPTKKSGLSFVTLVKPLIVSGMLVYYVLSKLLVSLGNFLIGYKNYLLDRRILVILPGVNSDCSKIFAGVPQGSILAHCHFWLF